MRILTRQAAPIRNQEHIGTDLSRYLPFLHSHFSGILKTIWQLLRLVWQPRPSFFCLMPYFSFIPLKAVKISVKGADKKHAIMDCRGRGDYPACLEIP